MIGIGLDQTASVYVPNGTDGDFDSLSKSGLACRLAYVTTSGGGVADERVEASHMRRLLWGADYTMPDQARVVIGGETWQVEPETVEAVRGPGGTTAYHRATCVKVL